MLLFRRPRFAWIANFASFAFIDVLPGVATYNNANFGVTTVPLGFAGTFFGYLINGNCEDFRATGLIIMGLEGTSVFYVTTLGGIEGAAAFTVSGLGGLGGTSAFYNTGLGGFASAWTVDLFIRIGGLRGAGPAELLVFFANALSL